MSEAEPGGDTEAGSRSGPRAHVSPFFCPYCGEEDLVPLEAHGQWACRACRRAFRLALTAVATTAGTAAPDSPDSPDSSGTAARSSAEPTSGGDR